MGTAHYFVASNPTTFGRKLADQQYSRSESHGWVVYSRLCGESVIKHYGFWRKSPARVRVTYELLHAGRTLLRIANRLKKLNRAYLHALPVWITKRARRAGSREKNWQALQDFLLRYRDLIDCFRYAPDEQLSEGNQSFNLEIAATPNEQTICLQFIRGLLAAYSPFGLVRGRRQVDKPTLQRNGWIKRFALNYKKRGWVPREIAQEIQKELREGTWNERSKLQYNLAGPTICKIAGMKVRHYSRN
jgi:hypothetical protein